MSAADVSPSVAASRAERRARFDAAARRLDGIGLSARERKRAEVPELNCPSCGVGLIKAHERGRFDEHGNFTGHRDECRCRWCDWVWWDDRPPVKCGCGALVRVAIDDGHAYAEEVSNG